MDTSPTTQHTSPAPIPALALDAFSLLVLRVQAEHRDAAGRIARAAAIVHTAGALWQTAELGVYRVASCQQVGVFYEATSHRCTCLDYTRRQEPCKHVWALVLLSAASAEAAAQAMETRYWLTAKAEQLLAAM
jgi:hypothetical protein